MRQRCDELLSSCAFNFDLCHYVTGGVAFGVIGTDTATGECVEIEDGPGLAVAVLHLPRGQAVCTLANPSTKKLLDMVWYSMRA